MRVLHSHTTASTLRAFWGLRISKEQHMLDFPCSTLTLRQCSPRC